MGTKIQRNLVAFLTLVLGVALKISGQYPSIAHVLIALAVLLIVLHVLSNYNVIQKFPWLMEYFPLWSNDRVFPHKQDLNEKIRDHLFRAHKADIYSISLGFLASYFDRLSTGLNLRVCIANVDRPHIRQRFLDELLPSEIEKGEQIHGPIAGKRNLARRCHDLFPGRVKVFEHYPTYGVYIFDDREVWFFLYGYQRLGYTCPVVLCSGNEETVKFFRDQFNSIYDDGSQPAEQVYSGKEGWEALKVI